MDICNEKRYLSVLEIAGYLGLSRWTILRMTKRQEIPFTAYGRVKKFDRLLIDEWVRKRTVQGRV